MKNRKLTWTSLGILTASLAVGCLPERSGRGTATGLIGKGEALPTLAGTDWLNQSVTNESLAGKVVMIDVWAIW
ncbi:MAG: hypothetical protein KDA87_15055 [Planctomycetales bacterium]|nr:hypothetical protein [Planctomycetales bacterium]